MCGTHLVDKWIALNTPKVVWLGTLQRAELRAGKFSGSKGTHLNTKGTEMRNKRMVDRVTERPDPMMWKDAELMTLSEAAALIWADGSPTASCVHSRASGVPQWTVRKQDWWFSG
jgi:hypothetical protein